MGAPAATRSLLLLASLTAAACASAPARPPGPEPLLPRSSVAALLAHRSDLSLDDGQVAALEQLDAELAQENEPILEKLRNPPPKPAGSAAGGAEHERGGGSRLMGAEPGMGGGMGGPRGMGGGMGPGPGRAPEQPPDETVLAERSLDDHDTQAFLQAEAILKAEQRGRGREIAERYREQLYDSREARRRRGRGR